MFVWCRQSRRKPSSECGSYSSWSSALSLSFSSTGTTANDCDSFIHVVRSSSSLASVTDVTTAGDYSIRTLFFFVFVNGYSDQRWSQLQCPHCVCLPFSTGETANNNNNNNNYEYSKRLISEWAHKRHRTASVETCTECETYYPTVHNTVQK